MAEKKAFENAFFRAAYDAAYIINCLHLAQENLPVKISSARLNSISGKWNKNFNSRKTIATSPARIWPNPISTVQNLDLIANHKFGLFLRYLISLRRLLFHGIYTEWLF